jgi:hypothetical protein
MKIIEIANGRSSARPTDPKSVLEQRLADLEATVRRRQRDWFAARAAAAAEPQNNLAEIITRERAARTVLEQELVARRAQYEKDIARAAAVRAMVDEQLREAGLEVRRAREAEASAAATVERLARAEAAAVARLAEREEEFASELSAVTDTRDGLEQQLSYVESALASARQRHEFAAAEVEQLARREAELSAHYAEETASRAALEQRVADVETALAEARTAHADVEERHTSAMATAATRLAELETQFEAEVASLTATRDGLEQQLRGVETVLAQQIDARLALERALAEQRSAASYAERRFLGDIAALTEREAQLETDLASIAGRRDSLEEQLRGVEARLAEQTAAREALEQAIAELRSTAVAAEQRFREETATLAESGRAERARLEDRLSRERSEHQVQLADEQQLHRSAMATAASRLAEREARLQAELASITATRASIEQQLRLVNARLEEETETRAALERAIADARTAAAEAERRFRDEIAALTESASAERAEALATFRASVAERDSRIEEQAKASAALQTRLDASETENRRQFEQTPVPLVRLTRDGAVEGANDAFAALVGCRTPGELRDGDFAATLFESRSDLAWLIERSANSTKTGSVETTCIRKDGVRLAVRLSARPSASGCVEIAVENLTSIRVLEDRLREAHRMEAVGRVASEIAMTCEKLLRDVYREAQRLLTTGTGSDGQHDRAATLLDDVTLAGSILHQLVAYGEEQTAALAPVDVNRILRDLHPVLKQVAGDAITLELRKTSSPVNVDVNAERVERLLVNVASYGRQRMPHGGRLRIELSTVVVDGKFIAQYPNVRQGPHALITVTEVARPAAEGHVSDHTIEADSRIAAGRAGVDLGTLQELISECGGHLWVTAEPGGSMVVRMRLPLRAAWEGQANTRARHGLGRMTARLLGR